MEDFASVWCKKNKLNSYLYFWGIQYYYLFKGNKEMYLTANELKEWIQLKKYKLKDFDGVNLGYIQLLQKIKIRTAADMLEQGKNPSGRKSIAEKAGVPEDYILELVKLSNLARIGG